MIKSPLMSRLRLGARIRELRDERKLTGDQLGAQTGLGRIAISRLERGERRPRLAAVLKVLDAFGIPDSSEEYRTLVRVARAADEGGWWEAAEYAGMGERQAMTADIESGTTTIREYQIVMPPGLLQTEAYARERAEATRDDGWQIDVEGTVEGRLRRQRQITDPGGSAYEAIVEELAIRRVLGSEEVMEAQLRHLLEMGARRNVDVRVLPVDARPRRGRVPRSPFSLYTYADPGDPLIVAVDTVAEDLLVTDQGDAAKYAHLYDRLCAVALSTEDSAALIHQVAEQLAAEVRA